MATHNINTPYSTYNFIGGNLVTYYNTAQAAGDDNPLPQLPFNDAPLDCLSIHFTGRENELGHLVDVFEVMLGDIPIRCVLFGSPGVGKSQLTLEWAKSSFTQGRYRYILWISATTVEKCHQGFCKILHLISHPDRSHPEQSVKLTAARRWLEAVDSGNWLLVLDNVARDTVDFFREHLPRKNGRGNILFTTRTERVAVALANAAGEQHKVIEIRIPNIENAVKLFLKHFELGEFDAHLGKVEELVNCVGRLPLAIAQAAAYIKQTGNTLDDMLALFKSKHKFDVINWENDLSEYEEKSVAATFICQLEGLEEHFPDASNLLKVLVFFDPECIPLNILITGANAISNSPQIIVPSLDTRDETRPAIDQEITFFTAPGMSLLLDIIRKPFKLQNTITQLQDQSLMIRQSGARSSTLWIHDLVQLVVLENTKKTGTERTFFECAVELACHAFGQVENPTLPKHWPQCEAIIPHIQSLSTRAEISSKTVASLLLANCKVAEYLNSRGRYGEAETEYERILPDAERIFGSEHIDTLGVMQGLAGVYESQGRLNDAERLLDRVLQGNERQLGPDHINTLNAMNYLASTYEAQGRYSDAKTLHDRALLGMTKQFGSENIHTLASMHNLACVYKSQGRYSDAEALFRRVLQGRQSKLGTVHIDTLTTMNFLASVYRSQGRYVKAEAMFHRAMVSSANHLGPEHINTLRTMSYMAGVYDAQGRYSEAETLLIRALSGMEKQLGPEHIYVIATIHILAGVFKSQGRFSHAEPLYNRVLRRMEALLGPEHISTLTAMHNLAGVYKSQGRYSDAEALLVRVLSSSTKQLGVEHIDTLATLHNLASIYGSQGRYADAELLLKGVLYFTVKQLGVQHIDTLTTMNYLAGVYKSEGRYNDAEALLNQALTGMRKQMGPEYVGTLTTMHNLAGVYRCQGRYRNAEVLLHQVLQGSVKQLGSGHVDTLATTFRLASVYKCQGRYGEAEMWFTRVLAQRERSLGCSHPDTLSTVKALASVYRNQGRLEDAKMMMNRGTVQQSC